MAPYDSDSSDDGDDYSTTNVILGYATSESTGDEISHVGGFPTWIDPNQPPPAALARCKVCQGYMSLLLQLNADLQQYFPQDERRLHVFCCRKKACSKKVGSIRALREVRKPERRESKEKQTPPETNSDKPMPDLGAALFGGSASSSATNGANPFSMSGSSGAQAAANPFSSLGSPSTLAAKPPQRTVDEPAPLAQSFADKLKIGVEPKPASTSVDAEPWPEQSAFPPPFKSFYLDAYPEELDKEPMELTNAEASKAQYEMDDSGGGAGASDKDDFESSLDESFQKFSDRIAQNPEQVLRYEFKGVPLLYSGSDGVASRFVVPHGKSGAVRGIPRCESCGAQRVFELQLVPGLIYELEKDEPMDLEDGMEWGTVIVGTCANNCGEPGKVSFREEWVGVQWEERVARK
ncbi:hypothetical protein HRR83_008833 [Exophiala dermatitidis]|uniref:Programmed cell death protein 2 C-terminal domain-containing protein n=2 Tax=Exophiala dermatitidis TaxID=5970 RepID=H6BXF8_EXODN|nr:uncharacterized protein HMPREF1120_03528 [Exophiala dermatitidis NIH/UT8656]KAJ4503685.1 hypothetical protein HRR73_008990 [Exophiala dermatitidis]EHY55389.1 hypothetical protein HMPREF1120_03528 [Exophiala dermatitidis NIH/UT8656]KAJ4506266.1 hypothetical protein HRR75_007121 [Exophiala dermatitidis]KAJ4508361.1 hypothetical protein HRR74_007760 [Exophiala dermatitidis]KAJ4533421.1 hypothetical protein HRR77_008583 [Exophiala dermatitidis]